MLAGEAPDLLSRRPWREVEAPAEVRAVPTMLSPQEQALLYVLARDYARGDGAIVDAGCFLGGSSAALLAGLRDRPEPWTGPPVHSYDRFVVEEYTLERYFAGEPVRPGDSFRPYYDGNVAGYGAPHVVHAGDLVREGWDGGPIEVLFLDVLKSWELNDAVLERFFAHVIPGRTVLIHQDYAWGQVPWLHITVELMWDALRPVDELPHATHAYLIERPLDPALLRGDLRDTLGEERKLALIDAAIARNEGQARAMVALSKAALLGELGRGAEARRLVAATVAEHPSPSVELCAESTRSQLPATRRGGLSAAVRRFGKGLSPATSASRSRRRDPPAHG
jgi:hypothetical protein